METMKYTERLLQDTEYQALVKKLEQAESDRRFCRHGLSHFLDAARIAWILALEENAEGGKIPGGLSEKKEQIYLTALLHDLGRIAQLEQGTPHHKAGAELAGYFLEKIGFPVERRREILSAIQEHRGEGKSRNDFINRFKKADNYSRNCFWCEARSECKWNEERKNDTVRW